MPRGATSWTQVQHAEGRPVMEGILRCRRRGCDASALLGPTTRHIFESNQLDWRLTPEERKERQAEWERRSAAMLAAPLPRGWVALEGLEEYVQTACSPRCARLICASYERKERG